MTLVLWGSRNVYPPIQASLARTHGHDLSLTHSVISIPLGEVSFGGYYLNVIENSPILDYGFQTQERVLYNGDIRMQQTRGYKKRFSIELTCTGSRVTVDALASLYNGNKYDLKYKGKLIRGCKITMLQELTLKGPIHYRVGFKQDTAS